MVDDSHPPACRRWPSELLFSSPWGAVPISAGDCSSAVSAITVAAFLFIDEVSRWAVAGMGHESEARQPAFEIVLQHLNGHAELLLIGELDMASAPILRHGVDRLVASGQCDLQLNLSGLTFLDAVGLRVLAEVRRRLTGLGGSLTVTAVHGIPLRVLTICAMLENLTAGGDQPATKPRPGTRA
jgi:anti-anti-sigma factor